jgi:nucleotide-binding universal stress UspA family protein
MEQAEQRDADLIVLGPHVRRAGSGFLGTTAERVLSGAGAPCLVVRAPLSPYAPHVTAAVDPGHRLDSVLDAALRWSLLFGDHHGSHGQPRFSALYVRSDRDREPPPELVRAVRDALARNGAGGRVDATVAVRGTDVVGSILLYAEAEVADLLVLSTRNRGILGRALLGSVSAEVTRRAPCNVLLVPPSRESGS